MSLRPEFEELYQSFVSSGTGRRLLEVEGIAPNQLDIGQRSYDFFNSKLADSTTDANSNCTENYSPTSYRSEIANGSMKLLGYHMLWHYTEKRYGRKFADEALSMIWNGDLYFHDAHGVKIQMPYCFAFSLDKLVLFGRPYGQTPNAPPKHRKSFISQVDKLISDLSKQFAGATAPSDFFLWYAYFCQKEGLDLHDESAIYSIINDLQGLVYLFNEPSRAEGESPFVNIGLYDMDGLNSLFGHSFYPNGDKADLDYIMELQMIFAEWFAKGDPETGFPFRFPVVTMNLTTDGNGTFTDKKTAKRFAEINRKKANFNIHFGDKAKLAMCCRYENDLNDMNMSPDSFGNGGVNIGSHRVITPHIARAAIFAQGDTDKFYSRVTELFDVASKLLIVHRYDILQSRIEKNPDYLMFFGKLGWFNLDTMFSTFGITGINEMCEAFGYDIVEDDGTDMVLDTLQYIRGLVKGYRNKYGVVFNIEEIPGEQACVSMMAKDKILSDNMDSYQLYSNQYIPLTKKVDIMKRIELSGRFMKIVSGGGISHLNLESQVDTPEKMYEIMKFAAKSGVTHMAICHRFGRCENGHANIIGTYGNKCPECGSDIYWSRSRVIGYFSDETNWHPIRRKYDAPNRYYSK